MPNRRNYQKELERVLGTIDKEKAPRLLLHVCCAPCSSYTLEYLCEYFEITLLYYNPNISPKSEYDFRAAELKRLTEEMPLKRQVDIIEEAYEPSEYYNAVKGLEDEPEGGARCDKCFELRLRKTAETAKRGNFDFFTTTLSISPLKSAEKLNNIGETLAARCGVRYLNSDFKKKGGYLRSIELSKEYNLYRQNYCGCIYSKNAR